MTRWSPDAQRRLREVALELYAERGFDATTVADIAARAGLTERTFFRHFADKREVLFTGSEELRDAIVTALSAAPDTVAPIDAVAIGLDAAAGYFTPAFQGQARRRNAIISANPVLRERELIKMATLGTAIAEALRRRGTPEPAANLLAEAGVGVFKVAFDQWVAEANTREWSRIVQDAFADLRELVAARPR